MSLSYPMHATTHPRTCFMAGAGTRLPRPLARRAEPGAHQPTTVTTLLRRRMVDGVGILLPVHPARRDSVKVQAFEL